MPGSKSTLGSKPSLFRIFKAALLSLCATSLLAACSNLEAENQVSAGESRPAFSGDTIVMSDGTELAVSLYEPATRPRGVLLALHGYADYARNYALAAPVWAARGFVVVAVDQRGFGRNADHGNWAGGNQMAADVADMIEAVGRAYPGQPLHLIGASMGGAVISSFFGMPGHEAQKGRVRSVVLAAPGTRGWRILPFPYRAALSMTRRIAPGWTFSGRNLGIVTTDNIEWLGVLADDPHMMREAAVNSLYGMAWLMDEAIASAPALTKPTFVVYGGKDEVIMPNGLSCFMARVPKTVRYKFYPGSYHLILRDVGRGPVVEDIADFLENPESQPVMSAHPAGLPKPPSDCADGIHQTETGQAGGGQG